MCQPSCGVAVKCEAGSHALGQEVLDPPSLPDSSAGQASESPALHRSPLPLRCLAWKTQKYLSCTHQACFSKPDLTLVRKPSPPLPNLHCSVSRGQPVTGRHISKPPDVRTVLTGLSQREVFFGSCFRFLSHRQKLPHPVHLQSSTGRPRGTYSSPKLLIWFTEF